MFDRYVQSLQLNAPDAFVCKLKHRVKKMSKDDLRHFPLLLKQSGSIVRATLHTEFIRHMELLREEIKTRFADVEEHLSKESWVMNAYTHFNYRGNGESRL